MKERPVRYSSHQESTLPKIPILDSADNRMQWFNVSKAADRFSKIRTEDLAAALAALRDSVIDNGAISVGRPL